MYLNKGWGKAEVEIDLRKNYQLAASIIPMLSNDKKSEEETEEEFHEEK